jgi:hypothetical protein
MPSHRRSTPPASQELVERALGPDAVLAPPAHATHRAMAARPSVATRRELLEEMAARRQSKAARRHPKGDPTSGDPTGDDPERVSGEGLGAGRIAGDAGHGAAGGTGDDGGESAAALVLSRLEPPAWCQLASVCKEWRLVLEEGSLWSAAFHARWPSEEIPSPAEARGSYRRQHLRTSPVASLILRRAVRRGERGVVSRYLRWVRS